MIVTNDFCNRLLPVETVCEKMQAKKHSKVFVIVLISSITFEVYEKNKRCKKRPNKTY